MQAIKLKFLSSSVISQHAEGGASVSRYEIKQTTKPAKINLIMSETRVESAGDWFDHRGSIARFATSDKSSELYGKVSLRSGCLKNDFIQIVDALVDKMTGRPGRLNMQVKLPGLWGQKIRVHSVDSLRAIGGHLPETRPA